MPQIDESKSRDVATHEVDFLHANRSRDGSHEGPVAQPSDDAPLFANQIGFWRPKRRVEQRDVFHIKMRLAGLSGRFVFPERVEPLAMPLEQSLGLDDQQRLFPMRDATNQHDQQPRVERREGWVFYLAHHHPKLLSQEGVFGDDFLPGSDQLHVYFNIFGNCLAGLSAR